MTILGWLNIVGAVTVATLACERGLRWRKRLFYIGIVIFNLWVASL